ncbi:MAG: alpha/beta hydrolase-fold protein [Bacteroidales bacterium]|nr:alpha/beta hydrolase-fold protein [Bacteroidales bacterium]
MRNRILFCLMVMFTCIACSEREYNEDTIEEQISDTVTSTMTQESFVSNSTTLNYWLYTPAKVENNMPLLIYLHGGSGKGSDLNIILENGFPKYLHDGDLGNLNAYVIIPQLSKDIIGWSNIATILKELITSTATKFHCDNTCISITGHSMGGTGTWSIAAKFPKLFYRIAPLSGSITNTEANVTSLKESNIWAFVGSADVIVNPQSTIDFIKELNTYNSKYTIINDATHFDVPQAYVSQEYKLVDWLLGE